MWDLTVLLLAVAVVGGAVYAVARGVDVRLVLLVAAFALAGLRGTAAPVVATFLATFSDEKFVVPICTAMGFAYVLRHTECDRHLVRLLTHPLRSARVVLVPGVVLAGFLVNVPVISQTSTVVCLGAVIVPLMRAARMSDKTIGASMLLGASLGGELLNPGAPELNTVAQQLTKDLGQEVSPKAIVPAVQQLVFVHLALTTLLFWLVCRRADRRDGPPPTPVEPPAEGRINLVWALVPLVPLVLLYLQGDPFRLFKVPPEWVLLKPDREAGSYDTRLIGLAMIVGVLVAGLANPWRVRGVPKAFFDGAGYAFTEVISLIVVARCFGTGIERTGLAKALADAIEGMPELLTPAAGIIPLAFAALSGSGMAATQSLYESFARAAYRVGADPKDVGAVVAIGAAAGRTMSPVAAVALMCAALTGARPFDLVKRVGPPLVAGLATAIALRAFGVV
jgi:C4-dicarboxylate transporter, DcuC family